LSEKLNDPAQHVAATLKFLHPGDEVFEICLISPVQDKSSFWEGRAFGQKKIVAGWFRDKEKAAALVAQIKAEGIYVTLNPCQEALLARAHERLKANVARSQDKEMAAIRNLLIDIDPIRPHGISSTDAEHEAAMSFTLKLRSNLRDKGWPEPLVGDSGNGAHLVYPLDLANTPENAELLKKVLGALAQQYAEELVILGLDLDTKNFNPSRLTKLYGTQTHKGDHTPARPHRWARIAECP
jgi:ribosome biogenesis protein Nip4